MAALLIAAAQAGVGPAGVPNPRPVDLGAIGLAAVLAGILALRRRHPFEVLIAVNVVMFVWLLAGYPGRVVALAPMIGIYTVAAHRGWARGLAASVVTGVAVVLVSFTVEGFGVVGEPPNLEFIATVYAAGTAVHYRRELLSAIPGA